MVKKIEGMENLVAARTFTMEGRTYVAGDRVDTSAMPTHKIVQFIGQRLLQPAPVDTFIDR